MRKPPGAIEEDATHLPKGKAWKGDGKRDAKLRTTVNSRNALHRRWSRVAGNAILFLRCANIPAHRAVKTRAVIRSGPAVGTKITLLIYEMKTPTMLIAKWSRMHMSASWSTYLRSRNPPAECSEIVKSKSTDRLGKQVGQVMIRGNFTRLNSEVPKNRSTPASGKSLRLS